jgi:hypothetical protein
VTIPLKSAVLCVDCEAISRGRNNQCELCGSHALMTLACVLDRATQKAKAQDALQAQLAQLALMGTA